MIGWTASRKLFWFAALSLADLVLTSILLQRAEGRACESNPVAGWWLDRFGWPGLAGFKLATILLVVGIVLVVSRHRPRAGKGILKFGCSALLAVVLYSGFLVYGEEADAVGLGQIRESGRDLDQRVTRQQAYIALLVRLGEDLVEHRRTLAGAVEALAEAEHVQTLEWLQHMQASHPGYTKDECLACQLVLYTLDSLPSDSSRSEQVCQDLDAQFRSCFGRPAP